VLLWKTFAPPQSDKCVTRYLNKYAGKPHELYIHPHNGPGTRNRRLARYEFLAGRTVQELNQRIERRDPVIMRLWEKELKRIVTWATERANVNTRIRISAGLEDNWTNKAYQRLVRSVRQNTPGDWVIVRNPVGAYEKAFDYRGASFIELHAYYSEFTRRTKRRGACIYNNDGLDIDLGDADGLLPNAPIPTMRAIFRRFRNDNCEGYLWWSGIQGIEFLKFIEPRARRFRVDPEAIDRLNKLIRSFEHEESN